MNLAVWKDTITVYQYDKANKTYEKTIVTNSFWDNSIKGAEKQQGTLVSNSIILFMPYIDELINLHVGIDRDAPYIVKGDCAFGFSVNSDDSSLVNQIRDFESQYKGQFWRSKEVHKLDFGSRNLWHFEVIL